MSTESKPNPQDDGIYRIIGGIYLSSYDPLYDLIDLKEKYNISNILSVFTGEVPEKYTKAPYTQQSIEIEDISTVNLLRHLHAANEFISTSLFKSKSSEELNALSPQETKRLKHEGSILIHCQAGCSRSVAILAAFLMKYYDMSLKIALYAIKRVKKDIEPNEGFMEQLALFEEIGKIDDLETLYQNSRYKLVALTDSMREGNVDGGSIEFLKDESFYKTEESTNAEKSAEYHLRCRNCRQQLAPQSKFIDHIRPAVEDENSEQSYFIKNAYKSRRIIDIQKGSDDCTHYFIEPIPWMKEELSKGDIEGKFHCFKCESKIGGYSWKGSRCSCGKWMIPAIHLQKAKVDKFKTQPIHLPNKINHESLVTDGINNLRLNQ